MGPSWAARDSGPIKVFRSLGLRARKIVSAPRRHSICLLILCVSFSYPIPPAEADDTFSFKSRYCKTTTEVKCVETAEINLLREGNVTAATCNCSNLCDDFGYKPTIHLLQYPSRVVRRSELNAERLGSSRTDHLGREEDFGDELQIEVYYGILKYHQVTEIPVYSTSDLCSAFGT